MSFKEKCFDVIVYMLNISEIEDVMFHPKLLKDDTNSFICYLFQTAFTQSAFTKHQLLSCMRDDVYVID